MRKLLIVDDFLVAAVAALGYGYGDTIARLSGWSEPMCLAACLVLGIVLEEIIYMIVFSKTVQSSPKLRAFTFAAVLLVFLSAHCASVRWMGVSMLDYLAEEFMYVVGLPILGFFINLVLRVLRVRKIRSLYEDGSRGFTFTLEKKDIEDINQENRRVHGEYEADCAVRTKSGIYVGEKTGKSILYAGIPYARPPVGSLRWKAPEPLPPSQAVFEARNFGASAIQVEHSGSIIQYHRQSEDCLTLNISTPAAQSETPRPVLVLFHPGDFTCGGSVNPLMYGGDYVSRHPETVVVSFNYRLGIFGFIDFSEVPGGEAFPDTLNLGLLDQIAALKWIRENISAFGGDPGQVTVLGFESGATSILLLAACPQAKGLFRKAFLFNGGPVFAYDTPEASRALAKSLLKETKTSTMEELCRLDTQTLKDASQKLWDSMCAPTCDAKLIPADVYQAFREGAASGIDMILGIPSREMPVLKSLVGSQRYMAGVFSFAADMRNDLDDAASRAVQAVLEAQSASSDRLEAMSRLTEQWLGLCIYRCAARLAEGGNPVHLMYWAEKPLIDNLGSGTVDAAAALLGNREALQMYGNVLNADISETLQALLLKFVTGEPLQLYPNEIRGIDAFRWEPFPQALIVSDGKLSCGPLADRLTEVRELLRQALS